MGDSVKGKAEGKKGLKRRFYMLYDRLFGWALKRLDYADVIELLGKQTKGVAYERDFLCRCLIDNSIIPADELSQHPLLRLLSPDDMLVPSHKIIYRAMIDIKKHNMPVDLISLHDVLTKLQLIDKAGGVNYLTSIIETWDRNLTLKSLCLLIKREREAFMNRVREERGLQAATGR